MSVQQSDYETLLAEYSTRIGAIALLKQYRPYLEAIPSIRRPEQSLITYSSSRSSHSSTRISFK